MSSRRTVARLFHGRTLVLSFILASLLVVLPQGVSAAEPQWIEVRSAHFDVVTDAGEKKGREVALRFEQMRAVFGEVLGRDRLNESRPLTILGFKNDKTYYQLAPLHQGQPIAAPGFFLPGD